VHLNRLRQPCTGDQVSFCLSVLPPSRFSPEQRDGSDPIFRLLTIRPPLGVGEEREQIIEDLRASLISPEIHPSDRGPCRVRVEVY
jgi:hypothetical protein